MRILLIVTTSLVFILIVGAILLAVRKLKLRRNQPQRFREKWLNIQRLCASKETWILAVINADKLLDNALKEKHIKGRSMGERLVSAQRRFKDNDSVWYAHNLAKKLLNDSDLSIREAEAKKSLLGVRQALGDLGILYDK